MKTKSSHKTETATFAAGCFWTPELKFSKLKGVKETKVGYTGGNDKKYPKPSYEQVCSDETGFAEAVQVTFDNKIISYEKLLEEFWKMHDPTQMNRQGPDFGSQYRSAIFYHDESQRQTALKSKITQQKKLGSSKRIVTEITPAGKFHSAEEYHQKYLEKRGMKFCH